MKSLLLSSPVTLCLRTPFNKLLRFQNTDHKSKLFARIKYGASIAIAHSKTVNLLLYE
jgi:hypothetical protein